MTIRPFSLLLALALAAHTFGSQAPMTYDSKADWVDPVLGMTQPVNGWYYLGFERSEPHQPGHQPGIATGAYHELVPQAASSGTPPGWVSPRHGNCSFRNFNSGGSPSLSVNTSSDFEAVRAWVAPGDGLVSILEAEAIRRTYSPPSGGDGSFLQVWRNGYKSTEWYMPQIAPYTLSGFNDTFRVNAGDTIYFRVHAGAIPWDDGLRFQPKLTFTPGLGHDATMDTRKTSAGFGTSGHFDYLYYHQGNDQYVAMISGVHPTFGPYFGHPAGYYCRIYQDVQHPLMGLDTVTKYQAPKSGELFIFGPEVAKTWDAVNGVQLLLYHEDASGARRLVDSTDANDPIFLTGRHFDNIVHVQAGDLVYLHVRNLGTSNSGLFTDVSFKFNLHPDGLAPTLVTGTADHTLASDEYRFHEHWKIAGDVNVPSGTHLHLRHSILQLENTEEREFAGNFDGKLTVDKSVLGGNRTPNAVLHSNFYANHPNSQWITRDAEIRYTYGQLGGNSATFDFDGHRSFVHGDFIHISGSMSASLNDTTAAVGVSVDVPSLSTSGATPVALPLRSPSGTTQILNGLGNWTLSFTNLWATGWVLKLRGLSNTGQAKLIDISGSEKISLRVSGGHNLQGTLSLPVSRDEANNLTPLPSSIQLFDTTWVNGTTNEIAGWNADFGGGSDVRLLGPTSANELMAFSGSRVALVGTPGTHDARSNATTIRSVGTDTRMILDNIHLGTPWTRGEVKAESGARVSARDIDLAYPVRFKTEGATSKIIVSTDDQSGHPNVITAPGERAFEVRDHWSFDDNIGEWRNWNPTDGFAPASSWSVVPVLGEPNNRALYLKYPDPATVSQPLYPRIVTPRTGVHPYHHSGGATYLYLRAKIDMANPRTSAGSPVVRLEFSGRAGGNWSTWGPLVRRMDLIADGQWHDYCWNIADPNDPNTNLDDLINFGSATSIPSDFDYFGLRFGTSVDTITYGDNLMIDFITVGPSYEADLRD